MTKTSTASTSAIQVLKADHEEMRKALTQLEKATGSQRRLAALARAKELIVVHAKSEEAVFYPAFEGVAETKEDRKMFLEAHEEHHLIDFVIAELEVAPTEGDIFAARAKVLKDVVEHHAKEEETEMFPRARKLLDRASLYELGTRLLEFKRSAVGSRSPIAPRKETRRPDRRPSQDESVQLM